MRDSEKRLTLLATLTLGVLSACGGDKDGCAGGQHTNLEVLSSQTLSTPDISGKEDTVIYLDGNLAKGEWVQAETTFIRPGYDPYANNQLPPYLPSNSSQASYCAGNSGVVYKK
ncbi:hypothetical protein IPM62_01310 [Candidatus Woesebacteria bacterium]|nr:MAG: hypothetical protein IPM62_01310 [Candidatus Woesebacteria bacterium]